MSDQGEIAGDKLRSTAKEREKHWQLAESGL